MMVWNTIVHPKMMQQAESDSSGENNKSFVQYANNYKLGTYDIIVDMTHNDKKRLIAGDFTELKRKLFSGEIIKGLTVAGEPGMFVGYDLDKYMYHAATDEDSEYIEMLAYMPSGTNVSKTMMELRFILLPDNAVEGD